MCVMDVIKIIHYSEPGTGNERKSDVSHICNLLIGVDPSAPGSGVFQNYICSLKVSLNLVFYF